MATASRTTPRRPRRRRIRKLRLVALSLVLLALSVSAFTFGLVSAVATELPSLDPEARAKRELNGYVYASDGKTILAVLRGAESRVLLRSDDIAPVMKQAIVAVEDRRFWDHRGIDLRGIGRALWADVRNQGLVEGGSTITQQFVKNVYIRNQRTLSRKLREAALAWQLEQRWPKNAILTEYLNTIYFGNGAYGVQQASKVYFDKGADRLTLPEAALLAGIPADPAAYDPVTRPDAARGRRGVVLQAMVELGDITPEDYVRAAAAPLPDPETVGLGSTQGKAPYFTNYVKQQLVDRYGPGRVFGGGLRVRTTIDLELQELAHAAIAKWLRKPDGPSAALVAVDARDGDVLAMVGGRNFRESQFNLAVQGERQPGSAFKPFVLAAALEQGLAPPTRFVSKPVDIFTGDRVWRVENYEQSYLGSVDLATATVHSDNAVYAQLTKLVGPAGVARTARKLGIASPLQPYFSIGLGAQAVNPLELASAYSAFANGGFRIGTTAFGARPRAIRRVWQPVSAQRTKVVDENRPRVRRVLSPRTAATVNALLQDVVERGTARAAALPGWPAAGKTGTTENYGDAWFVGYTPDLVVAVWVGYAHKTIPMLTEFRGEPVAGGTYPALIWKSFMERALEHLGKKPKPFAPLPRDSTTTGYVVQRDGRLARDNGVCRGAVAVVYFVHAGPPQANCRPNEVEVPRVVGQPVALARAQVAAQPLTPRLIYTPAAPRQPLGVVVDQRPRGGRLSSYDEVLLVLPKPLHGVVPDLRGLTIGRAEAKLKDLDLEPRVNGAPAATGKVVAQQPKAGVAAAPGMVVELVVEG